MDSAGACAPPRGATCSVAGEPKGAALGWPRDPPDRTCFLQRLRRKTDLDRLFREGRRFHSPWAVLQVRPRTPQEGLPPGPRLAVIAGRSFRTAVARNRARRLLRETCRVILGDAQGQWDLILIARPEVLGIPLSERVRVLSHLLTEAGVLGEKAVAAA